MKTVFVIKNSKSDFPLSVCWEEATAIETVETLNSIDNSHKYNYTEVPIHFQDGTEVNIIAPPIKREYLPTANHNKLVKKLEKELFIKININSRTIYAANNKISVNLLDFAKAYGYAIQLQIE